MLILPRSRYGMNIQEKQVHAGWLWGYEPIPLQDRSIMVNMRCTAACLPSDSIAAMSYKDENVSVRKNQGDIRIMVGRNCAPSASSSMARIRFSPIQKWSLQAMTSARHTHTAEGTCHVSVGQRSQFPFSTTHHQIMAQAFLYAMKVEVSRTKLCYVVEPSGRPATSVKREKQVQSHICGAPFKSLSALCGQSEDHDKFLGLKISSNSKGYILKAGFPPSRTGCGIVFEHSNAK